MRDLYERPLHHAALCLRAEDILSAEADPPKSARLSRALKRLHIHGLIAKIPPSRRWRVTDAGNLLMPAAVRLREDYFLDSLRRAA